MFILIIKLYHTVLGSTLTQRTISVSLKFLFEYLANQRSKSRSIIMSEKHVFKKGPVYISKDMT